MIFRPGTAQAAVDKSDECRYYCCIKSNLFLHRITL